jgi:TonB family protein
MSKPYGRVISLSLAVALGVAAPLLAREGDPASDTVDVGGDLVGPQIILETQKPPVFPPAAKAARFSGSVMVEAIVLRDGKVGEVKVLDCTRPKVGFEQASIDAVKNWRFEPGTKAGEPVEYTLKFRMNFSGAGEVPRVSAGSFVSAAKAGGEQPMAASDTGGATRNPR